jgi:ABC-2 type transport system ATP-binding protein
MNAISCQNLVKSYKGTNVVDINSLEIKQGSFFGILGPNGAGKSTLINIISSLIRPTSGSVAVLGKDIQTNVQFAKSHIGTAVQDIKLDPFLRVYEMLEYQAGYYGIAKKDRKTEEIMHHLGLFEHRDKKSRMLSGGMQRRLVIAKALVHNPDIIILDEPTAGVDIELRVQLWGFIRKLNDDGKTIIITTHYLEEAQTLCNEIAFIKNGQIIMQNSKDVILSILDKKTIVLHQEGRQKIEIKNQKFTVESYGNSVKINYAPSVINAMEVLLVLQQYGYEIKDFSIEVPSLDDVFSYVINS